MFGLIPKEEKFFAMFRDMTKLITEGAIALKEMLDDFREPQASKELIKEIERKCDLQTHDIIRKLNRSFITPFSREDIYSFTLSLDDIMDAIDTSAQHIVVYHIDKITPEAKELGRITLAACQIVEQACCRLEKQSEQVFEFCITINSLENEADQVRAGAISRLFKHEKDPINLIKWKEIYENLEYITDKCDDAGNILESAVLKNG